jgi:lipopolysaccharide transport system ATP-binding protein
VLGMSKQEIDRNFDEIVAFAEVERFIDTPVKRYSSGMYVRLAFAVAAHLQSEILLVDEVLAVGDAAFQKKCLGKMDSVAKEGRTVLFVSHSADSVRRLCQKAILLDQGRVVATGDTSDILARYGASLLPASRLEWPEHVLLRAPQTSPRAPFEITEIEMLDPHLRPKDRLRTWEGVTFRFHYRADEVLEGVALSLFISSSNGTIILNLSTLPEHGVILPLSAGRHIADCHIPHFPLTAGEYVLTAGLQIPYVRWLCRYDDMAQLAVHPADVFKSGVPPILARGAVATRCAWTRGPSVPAADDRQYESAAGV